jgi:hypothetical protein
MFKNLLLFLICALAVTFSYASSRDPTCPPQKTASEGMILGDLQIKSIMISPHKKLVVIGDRYLTIGDEVMGAKIVAIDEDTVTFQGKNGQFIIAMFQPIVKNYK